MSFLGGLFRHSNRHATAALIDIGAASIGAAFVEYKEGEKPLIHYTLRAPIEVHRGEPHVGALVRTLQALGAECIKKGAPALARATGSGSVDALFVSVDAPWQELRVRTEHVKRDEPFTFTKRFVKELLENTRPPISEKLLADESIIGTILNGYETHDPYGKTAYRASVVILTSLIEERVSKEITSTLRGLFHTTHVMLIAGSSVRYQGMRGVFPHEQNALMLDVTESLTSVVLVRRGILVAITEVPNTTGGSAWMAAVMDECRKIAKRYPLPRTIFLLTREADTTALQKTLGDAKLGELWLSENPPKIVPVVASHLTELVQQTVATPPDLVLFLMAINYQQRALDA